MSAKIPTPVIFQITLFWNKGYEFIIHADHVTNRILSCDSNNIVDLFMWPKFGNPRISTNEVITTSILQGFGPKKTLFEEWSLFKFNNLGLALGTKLKFYTSVAKELKLKLERFCGLTPTL